MTILEYKKFSAFVALIVFALSLLISPHYMLGDQEIYRRFFEILPTLSFADGFIHYSQTLTSIEPGYYTISWIFSRFLEKDLFISILNAILAFYSMQLLIRWRASIYVAASIVLTTGLNQICPDNQLEVVQQLILLLRLIQSFSDL